MTRKRPGQLWRVRDSEQSRLNGRLYILLEKINRNDRWIWQVFILGEGIAKNVGEWCPSDMKSDEYISG